jgi:hypothetical protein
MRSAIFEESSGFHLTITVRLYPVLTTAFNFSINFNYFANRIWFDLV